MFFVGIQCFVKADRIQKRKTREQLVNFTNAYQRSECAKFYYSDYLLKCLLFNCTISQQTVRLIKDLVLTNPVLSQLLYTPNLITCNFYSIGSHFEGTNVIQMPCQVPQKVFNYYHWQYQKHWDKSTQVERNCFEVDHI